MSWRFVDSFVMIWKIKRAHVNIYNPKIIPLVYRCQKKDHFLAFPNELKLERVTREAGA